VAKPSAFFLSRKIPRAKKERFAAFISGRRGRLHTQGESMPDNFKYDVFLSHSATAERNIKT